MIAAALWGLVENEAPSGSTEKHAKFGFYVQRKGKIVEWAAQKDTRHPMAEFATEYLSLAPLVMAHTGDRLRREANIKRLHEVESELNKYYLDNIVDVVFVTCSASAHPTLRDFARPKVVLIDEAAVTPIPDTATPLGAHFKSIEHVTLCGDHKQQHAVVPSIGANEFASNLAMSLFETVKKTADLADFQVQLEVQHRMTPQLSKMPNAEFYEGTLKDAPSTHAESTAWNTMEAFLVANLGPAYNTGRRRVVFDVSGSSKFASLEDNKFISGKVQNTRGSGMSYDNYAEAAYIVEFVDRAIKFAPPPNGRKLELEDFMVLSPYAAQCHLIIQMAFKKQLSTKDRMLDVGSVRLLQGQERTFVVHSMVRNQPGKPLSLGFVTQADSLNVTWTRAREGMFSFGNYQAWTKRAANNGEKLLLANGKFKHFGNIARDIWAEKDLVAMEDLTSWLEKGTVPKASSILTRIGNKPAAGSSDRGQVQPSLFGQREEEADAEAAAAHKKKTRRSKKKQKTDNGEKEDGPPDNGEGPSGGAAAAAAAG